VAIALGLASFLALVFHPPLYAPYFEGRFYVDIARGNYGHIPSYYGGRVVHPLLARLVAHLAGAPIDAHVFLLLSVGSLIAFFFFVAIYYSWEYSSAGGVWIFLLVTATVVDQYRNYYWHDLFYAAICALLFLALRANVWISLPLVLLLYMTRESTLILVIALLVVAGIHRKWLFGLAVLTVGLVGAKLDSVLLGRSLPGKHGIPMFVLDLLKLPYNFAYNVCGLELWTNTNASTLPPPVRTAPVPPWLHLGNIHEIGFCGFFWQNPVSTLLILAAAFGVLPLVVFQAVARGAMPDMRERVDLMTALVFGGLMFVLSPLTGTLPARYVLYGWPLFWIFGVATLNGVFRNWKTRASIIGLSLCVCWTPALVRLAFGPSISGPESVSTLTPAGMVVSLALILLLNVAAWRLTTADDVDTVADAKDFRLADDPPQ
jgi:hypothetical protein